MTASPNRLEHSLPTASTTTDEILIQRVTAFVKDYMSHYDASHDFNHILRVVGLSKKIASMPTTSPHPAYNPTIVTLAALLHDVGDRKYLLPGQDASTLVQNTLLSLGAQSELARTVQIIASNVSYSSEIKNPQKVLAVITLHPELAVVQDADRLDAIGAVGIGRCFTFGGAMYGKQQAAVKAVGETKDGVKAGDGGRGLNETMEHFEVKLVKLESMMKTEPGRDLAKVRTERLRSFMGWWEEEVAAEEHGMELLSEV